MEEKKKRGAFFSGGIKAVVIALFLSSVFVFTSAVLILDGLFASGMEWDYLRNNQIVSYEKTNSCGMNVTSYLSWLPDLIESGKLFGYDGELNVENTVDITDLSLSNKKQNQNTSYTVETLQDMAYESELTEIIDLSTNAAALEEFMESQEFPVLEEGWHDKETVTESIESEDGGGDTTEAGPADAEKIVDPSANWNFSTQFLYLYEYGKDWEERYGFPVSGISLADYARDNPEDVSLLELYKSLLEACEKMGEYMDAYYNMDVATNVMYYVENTDNGQIYTNVSEWQEGYSEIDIGADQDAFYLQVKRNNGRLERMKNLTDAEQYVYNYLANVYISGLNEKLIITIDTSYQEADDLQFDSYYYERYGRWGNVLLICMIVSAVIAVISLIMSAVQAGRRMGDNELHHGPGQGLPTEILLAVIALVPFMMSGIGISWLSTGGADVFAAVLVVVGELVMAGIFLVAYLGLVLKIKNKTLWKSSFSYTIIRLCKDVYLARKTSGRIIVSFIGLILINLILVMAIGGFGLLLAFVVDALVLLYLIRENVGRQVTLDGLGRIASGDLEYKIDVRSLPGSTREMAEAVNHVGDGLKKSIEEKLKSERLKADLITNVSHDIKTPLTSIINYVDLLKRADIQDPNVQGYIKVLDSKSQRLKQLTEDLVEASKISSGNIVLDMQPIRLDELIRQTNGEFAEKFAARQLKLICHMSDEAIMIRADGRRMWRVIENLYNNIAKYALPGSRVYVDLQMIGCRVIFVVKNISEYPLNIKAEELTERFIRGDVSRSTEGSGLGLSIAQNLVILQKGTFDIYLDGDLFKVTITFGALERSNRTVAKEPN